MRSISKDMKMCDLAFCSEQMPGLLNHFGIGFGFGEQTVDEVCKQSSVSTRLFLHIAGIYISNTGKLPASSLSTDEIYQVLAFLKRSHEYYHAFFFPKVHFLLHRVLEGYSDDEALTINKFFDSFEEKVFNHFETEDKQLFPHIEDWLKGQENAPELFDTMSFPDFHDTIESELSDLRSILVKYLDNVKDEFSRIELLGAIYSIGTDIHCHSIIEEQLIIPLVFNAEKI